MYLHLIDNNIHKLNYYYIAFTLCHFPLLWFIYFHNWANIVAQNVENEREHFCYYNYYNSL